MIITYHQDSKMYSVQFSEKELAEVPHNSDGLTVEQLIIKLVMAASEHRKLKVFDSHRESIVGTGIVTHLKNDDDRMPDIAVQLY